jgi:hypothetical protein
MFDEDGGDIDFWHKFMAIVCDRETRIRSSLDPNTIFLVLQKLSRMTRAKPAGVGPVSLSEVQRAFESVLGREPVEGASVMLQRLPGLGRTEVESDDRKFIDVYIVDGLRALDVARSVSEGDYSTPKEQWTNPLGQLGQRILAREMTKASSFQAYLRFAERGLHDGNHLLASDIVASALRTGATQIDFAGLTLNEGHITELDLSLTEVKRLAVVDSIIETMIFPTHPIDGVTLQRCLIEYVLGISHEKGLPEWITGTVVAHFDSVVTVSSIKNVRLSIRHRILVTILKKTFFQKGSGRQEAALLRGLGQIDRDGYTPKILGYLVTNDILEHARGDHGVIYVPVIKYKTRVGAMLSELNMSKDPIWSWVEAL